MLIIPYLTFGLVVFISSSYGDLTNLNDFLAVFKINSSYFYPVGFYSEANYNGVKRILSPNINTTFFLHHDDMLKAIDDEKIIAGLTTSILAEDLEPKYHIFSASIVSPQAMLLAPDYNSISTPYGLNNSLSNDLFDALNAAIVEVQRTGLDEKLLGQNQRTDLLRVYTCRQDIQLPVPNKNDTTGYLREILFDKKEFKIGGLGPSDWGKHDGNYKLEKLSGFYPELLDAIVKNLGTLKGPDGIAYGDGEIKINRTYYTDPSLLFRALLNGEIHATDVYLLIDAPYNGTGEVCTNNTSCRLRESCVAGICTHPTRPRSTHFRTTCTTASRDARFVTKKDSSLFKTNSSAIKSNSTTNTSDATRETPKTRWIGFLILFVVLFGAIFLILLILVRRKKHYRVEHTVQGGVGKFARLREEPEQSIEVMDSFDDHVVQSPTIGTSSSA